MHSVRSGQLMSDKVLRSARFFLVVTVWTSTLIFGLYILAFYAMSLINGHYDQWNKILPGLYDAHEHSATIGIGLHFLAGGIILILGCVQMMEAVRVTYPFIHRYVGRLYVVSSLLVAVGGLYFIMMKGTVGGWVMDVGFGLYGVLMGAAAFMTVRYARSKMYELHRAYAIRLFALALGSWLYRMDYGFWFALMDGYGHTADFRGPFDYVMSFFFYIPNLIVAEIIIARYDFFRKSTIKMISAAILLLCSAFLAFASYYFIEHLWGPAIVNAFIG